MKILFLTLEQSTIKHTPILDWITSPEIGQGRNAERYWLFNTGVALSNPHKDYEVEKLITLMNHALQHEFTQLMIGKTNDNGTV